MARDVETLGTTERLDVLAQRARGVAEVVGGAERWAAAQGATALVVGAAAPVYLFTGVDSTWTEALCCFESLGYERVAVELDLVCPTRPSTRPPKLNPWALRS